MTQLVTNTKKLVTVILAAGASRRFNGIKQLAQLTESQYLLAQTISQLNLTIQHYVEKVPLNDIEFVASAVVLGANQSQIAKQLVSSPKELLTMVDIIDNPNWAQGLSSSIHRAVDFAMLHQADGLLIALGDQVAITALDFTQLIQQWDRTRQTTCAFYQQDIGVPAIFLADDFDALRELDGDSGAKKVLKQRQNANSLTQVELTHAAIDIDTPADLSWWLANKE